MRKKSKLDNLTKLDVEKIVQHAESRSDIPLIKSVQVNMRLNAETLEKIKALAKRHHLPYTTYISKLLLEDVERLWSVFGSTPRLRSK